MKEPKMTNNNQPENVLDAPPEKITLESLITAFSKDFERLTPGRVQHPEDVPSYLLHLHDLATWADKTLKNKEAAFQDALSRVSSDECQRLQIDSSFYAKQLPIEKKSCREVRGSISKRKLSWLPQKDA